MTQTFGESQFRQPVTPVPLARDAFDQITGELFQGLKAQYPERTFLDENVQAVAAAIHGEPTTQVQREAEVAPYIGRWLVVAFALGDHQSRFGMEIVRPLTPAQLSPAAHGQNEIPLRYSVTAIFDTEPWHEKIASFAVGTKVIVMGSIEQITAYEVRLRNCELV